MDPIKNFDEVMANIRRIATSPMHPYTEETIKKLNKEYYDKNKKSLEMFEEAKKYIPGGVQHNLSLNHPFPLAVDRVKGCKIWDVDGKEYIDYLMCGGPIIIGHAVDEAILRTSSGYIPGENITYQGPDEIGQWAMTIYLN